MLISQRRKNVLICKSNHNWRLTMALYAERETCGPWWEVLLMLLEAVEVFLISWTTDNKIPLRIDAVAYSALRSSLYHRTPTSLTLISYLLTIIESRGYYMSVKWYEIRGVLFHFYWKYVPSCCAQFTKSPKSEYNPSLPIIPLFCYH